MNEPWTALIEDTLGGDRAAMERLVVAALPIIRHTAAQMATGPDADDIVQEALIDVVRRVRTVREPERFAGWVRTVARHAGYRHFSRGRRQVPVAATTIESLAGRRGCHDDSMAQDLVDRLATVSALRGALSDLPDSQRTVVGALMASDGASYEDAAIALGRPIGGLGPTRGRAIAKLRVDGRVQALFN